MRYWLSRTNNREYARFKSYNNLKNANLLIGGKIQDRVDMTSGEYNMAQVWLKRTILAFVVLAGGISIFYGSICVSIFTEVNEVCKFAVRQFKGEELLTATVMLLESEEVDFTVKNRAVYPFLTVSVWSGHSLAYC